MQPHSFPTLQDTSKQLQEAAIDERLMMTPEERVEAHENARQLVADLKNAGDIARAKSESSS